MKKIYWWCKIQKKERSLKDDLVFYLSEGCYFRLDLFRSYNSPILEQYLFSKYSGCIDHSDGSLTLTRFRTSSTIGLFSNLISAETFENRLIDAEYSITLLTEEQYNNYLHE